MWHLLLAAICLALVHGQDPVGKLSEASFEYQIVRGTTEEAVALGLAFVTSGHLAERDEVSDQLIRAEEESAEARRLRIQEEIDRIPTHHWAGAYRYGDGLGMNISLWVAPESGAVYTWHGCMGLYDVNHGEIKAVSGEGIEVSLAIDALHNWRVHEAGLPRPLLSARWLFVTWGKEVFLIPSAQMIPFCNAVNGGGSVRMFPRRGARTARGPDVRPQGLPTVPTAYEPFLLSEPLVGTVSRCEVPVEIGTYVGGEPRKFLIRATLDIGVEQGVLPGMLIYAEGDPFHEGEVTAAGKNESIVEFRYPEGKRELPQVGTRASTLASRL
jgi:hypothetical protein